MGSRLSWAESYLGSCAHSPGHRTLLFVGARTVVRNPPVRSC